MSLPFSDDEVDTLKQIVGDWVEEGVAWPPYDPHVQSILDKLGVPGKDPNDISYPKTLEYLSTPWGRES